MLIDIIVASERDVLKIASVINIIDSKQDTDGVLDYRLIYTGKLQHQYSLIELFRQLNIPIPDITLEVEPDTETAVMAATMVRYEKILGVHHPDLVLVSGGSTAALACCITAAKHNIKTAHLEAGAPISIQEPTTINYRLIDSIADYLFTTSHYANEHLRMQHIAENKIFLAGNTFIDTFHKQMPAFRQPAIWTRYRLQPQKYFVVSLSEDATTAQMKELLLCLLSSIAKLPIVILATAQVLKTIELTGIKARNLLSCPQLPFNESNYLLQYAMGAITDNSHWQDETTFMRIPCITLLNNTYKPETTINGTNEMAGWNMDNISTALRKIQDGKWKRGNLPYMWDRKSAARVVSLLKNLT